MLTVTTHELADVLVLHCRGRLVHGEECSLVRAAIQYYGREVILDLTEVTALDAAGVGALVSLQAAGVYLKLINAAEPVRTVLRLTGMETVLEVCEGQEEDALAEVGLR